MSFIIMVKSYGSLQQKQLHLQLYVLLYVWN